MPSFSERLNARIRSRGTPVLVGLDPRWECLPEAIRSRAAASPGTILERTAQAFEVFCREVIDVVSPLVAAIKPQVAFFEQLGHPGLRVLKTVMQQARKQGLIVIADAKRGDIGTTATAYANAWLAGEDDDAAPWPADAVTVNPYLGCDALEPFTQVARQRNGGIYVLVRTSNPGAADFQDLTAGTKPLYEAVAEKVEALSAASRGTDRFGCIGAVVGATWPEQLSTLRAGMPSTPFLIPGFGAQGATAGDVAAAFCEDGLGAIVNNSRGINFAFSQSPWKDQFPAERWQDAVAAATREMIADLAAATPAGALSANR